MSLEETLVLGRYRVLLPLDEKKLVNAYLARDEHPGGADRPILIKQFLRPFSSLGSLGARELLDELAALEQLRSPGIVSLLGHEVEDDRLLTAQELLPGASLLALCDQHERSEGRFPTHLAVYIVRRLLSTLQACHTHPGRAFVHGRINLSAVYLPRTGEPQISDFGLARLVHDAAEAESVLGYFLTQISYLAPEVPRDRPATPQNDIYSLGLILYRLLSGKNPFQARTVGETLQRVLSLRPAPIDVPGWDGCEQANAILAGALAKDPSQRYQDCRALYDALGPLQTGSDESLAEELSLAVRELGSDWGRITLMPDSVKRTPRRRSLPAERLPLARFFEPAPHVPVARHFESAKPAFASGLVSEQPRSLTEHTRRAQESPRERWPLTLRVGFAALLAATAAAIILGINVGKTSDSAAVASAAGGRQRPAAAREPSTGLRACGDRFGRDAPAKAELLFDEQGALSAVRLLPPELVGTQLGACLLDAVWKMNMSALGTKSLMLDLAY